MKYLFLLFFFIQSFLFFGQESVVTKLDTTIYRDYNSLKANTMYSFNDRDFNYLAHKEGKKLKLVYTFALWCVPCKKMFPKILQVANKYRNDLQFYLVTMENNEKELNRLRLFYTNEKLFARPAFNISNNVSGKYYKNLRKKYSAFVQAIVPEHKEYGLSLAILYNTENKVIYASTYNELMEDVVVDKLISAYLSKR